MFGIGLAEALNNYKKRVVMAIQMSVVMFLAISCVSIYLLQIKEYEPYKKILNGKGVTAFVQGITDGIEGVLANLKDVDKIVYCKSESVIEKVDGKYRSYVMMAFDDATIKYEPIMAQGHWINNKISKTDEIEAVVNANLYDVKIGDVLELENYYGKSLKVRVVGVLIPGALTFAPGRFKKEDTIYDWFAEYDYTYGTSEDVALYISMKDMDKINMGVVSGKIAVKYKDNIPEIDELRNDAYIKSLCSSEDMCNPLSVTYNNTKAIINGKVMTILPVLICSLILVTFGVASLSVLEATTDLNRYSVMYLTGMKWKGCIIICAVRALVEVIVAFAFMWVIRGGVLLIGGRNIISFVWDKRTILTTFGVMGYFFLVTVLPPAVILRFNSPITLLRKSRV